MLFVIVLISLYCNFDLKGIVTPVNPDRLYQLLAASNYDITETEFLVKGFREGFDISYDGPTNRRNVANNIPLQVGSKEELWSNSRISSNPQ